MPTSPITATPDLDAFLHLHLDDAGVLAGELDPSARATWLCWMCWATPVTGAAPDAAGR